ncbi:hypothetical protein CDV36_013686 [Fusarium kuroshium]|uniref:Uncharacterized protein n=1 Tax=Fusarium kuroshium TaxID=2010991 RepID=A0A3M2RMZ7_9HYPO|nr:hypothetical protein CDV36_013686 [Fusarium kuroshium]
MAEEFFTRATPKLKGYCISDEQIDSLKTCVEGQTAVEEATQEEEPTGEGEGFMDFDDGFFWRELTDWASSWADDYNHYGAQYLIEKSEGKERQKRQVEWINSNIFAARLASTGDRIIALCGAALDTAEYITMGDLEKKDHETDLGCIEAAAQLFIHAAPELLCLVRADPTAKDIHSVWSQHERCLLAKGKDESGDKWKDWRKKWARLAEMESLPERTREISRKALEAMDQAKQQDTR